MREFQIISVIFVIFVLLVAAFADRERARRSCETAEGYLALTPQGRACVSGVVIYLDD